MRTKIKATNKTQKYQTEVQELTKSNRPLNIYKMTFKVVDIKLTTFNFIALSSWRTLIKYKPSIDKFYLAHIIQPYNKRQSKLLRLSDVQSFIKKQKECFMRTTLTPSHKKEHI